MGAVKKVNSFLTMESENYEGTMGIAQNILVSLKYVYYSNIVSNIFAFVFHFSIQTTASLLGFA